MKKTGLILLVLAVVVGLGGYFILTSRSYDGPETASDTARETGQQSAGGTNSLPGNQATADTDDAEATSQVEIVNMAYQPANITVQKGTTVTWVNKDSVRHDVMPDEESDAFKGSRLLAKDESYSFTFNTPGTYAYHCSPHPHMTGTVTVTE